VRLPVWLCERIADISRADRALYDGATCTPATDEQVASHLRLSVAEVSAARRASESGISLEAPAGNRLGVSDHGPNRTLADIVRAPATHPD
ncbi:sigma-70 domain-containing protein, partial [Mesorhizobium sp. WSM4962]|uniref:sigma-70 domain-containing protein n=1 Tax=Mesorhizobium sp. WSM4962 TaxID=3038548 RepID=UPI0024179F97